MVSSKRHAPSMPTMPPLYRSSHRCLFAVVLPAFFHATLSSALLSQSLPSLLSGNLCFLPLVLFSTLAAVCFPAPFITNCSAVVPRSYDSCRVPLSYCLVVIHTSKHVVCFCHKHSPSPFFSSALASL